eukprot:COSAG06_NODE_23514_length_689_cov_1.069492_1_plen_168_part_10
MCSVAVLAHRRQINERVENTLAGENASALQVRFHQCIEAGVLLPSDDVGCFACEPDDYEMFWPFFSRVLEQIHGLGAEPEEKEAAANSPVSPSADEADHSSKWTLDDALLFEDIGVEPLPLCLSVSRNIEGFTMIATMDQQERISLEDCLTDAFDSLIEMPEWSGRYF